jgi:enoyl-CoA hydratase/carnithine racemase
LESPARASALNVGLLEELCAVLAAADQDEAQRVFVLRAAGPFSARGFDCYEAADGGGGGIGELFDAPCLR